MSSSAAFAAIAKGRAPLVFDGPWALFHMFDRFGIQPSPQPEKFSVTMNLDDKKATFEVVVLNPLRLREIQQFRCPGAL